MNKIKLTEAQLHRVIKESVKRILSEIKIGGESLHGNNPEDWSAIENVRGHKLDSMPLLGKGTMRNARACIKDLDNAEETYRNQTLKGNPQISDKDYLKGWQDMRSKASKKARNIEKNIR